jgi:hypothetical protein
MVHALTTPQGDGWVVDIPKYITYSGTSTCGEGWNEALRHATIYLSSNGYDTISIFTTNRKTRMSDGYSCMFKRISWNYIIANQVDHELRQRVYNELWK